MDDLAAKIEQERRMLRKRLSFASLSLSLSICSPHARLQGGDVIDSAHADGVLFLF